MDVMNVEVIQFASAKGAMATVVTDGVHHHTYTQGGRQKHSKLSKAIAYLEARHYNIITDAWQ